MEPTKRAKKAKSDADNCSFHPVRLKQATYRKLQKILDAANKKDFGRRVRAESVIDVALSLVSAPDIEGLRSKSMSNADRFEAAYRSYAAKDKALTKDDFMGMLLAGKANATPEAPSAAAEESDAPSNN